MVRTRYRSTWNSQSTIPRLGFLLFILALAIVGWPKLRPMRDAVEPSIPAIERSPQLKHTDGVVSAVVTADEVLDGRDFEKDSDKKDGDKKDGDSEKTGSMREEDLAIDGQTRDLLSVVTDNSLRMTKREMPAYWELVRKTANSSFNDLYEVSNSRTKFSDFYNEPAKHRGELVTLDIVVRRVTKFDAESGNSAGIKSVYEIWGSTDQSQAWLYVFITNTLPEGFDEETLLRKKTAFAGYFLKLLAYQPGSAPPNAKPLLAPLLVGRFKDIQQATPTTKSEPPWWSTWEVTSIIVLLTVFFTVRVLMGAKQKRQRRRDHQKSLSSVDPTWLESDPSMQIRNKAFDAHENANS